MERRTTEVWNNIKVTTVVVRRCFCSDAESEEDLDRLAGHSHVFRKKMLEKIRVKTKI